jgi:hypothetical protein
MPQLDKEIYIECFIWNIFLLLILQADSALSENMIRSNVRFSLMSFFKNEISFFKLENQLISKYIELKFFNVLSRI